MRIIRALIGTASSALVVALSTSAIAQNSQAGAEDLGEIVVTAQKSTESIYKVPLAITAISGDALLDQGVMAVKDLTSVAPNVQIHTIGVDSFVGVTIRGISNGSYTPDANPAVSTYVDGIYVGLPVGFAGEMYDLERLEILRGPQGTLYGRNATGGNLNLITASPKSTFGGSADLSYGSYGDVLAHGVVNVPVSDTLALRASAFTHRSDGYFTGPQTTARGYGVADDYGARLTALFKPSNNFSWRLSYSGYFSHGTPGASIATGSDGKPLNGLPVYKQPASPDPEPYNSIQSDAVRSRMDWNATEDITVSYIAGYQHAGLAYAWGTTGQVGAPANAAYQIYSSGYSANSTFHEVDVAYKSERFKNLLGGSFYYEADRGGEIALKFPILGIGGLIPSSSGAAKRSSGIFDQATYSILPDLRLTAGVRYSNDFQKSPAGSAATYCLLSVNPTLTVLDYLSISAKTPGCFGSAPASRASASFGKVTWRGGVEYDVTPDVMSYATVSTGYKQGGVQPTAIPPFPTSFLPETVTNYETGLKGRFFGKSLSLSAAAFLTDYKDLQVFQYIATGTAQGTLTTNAGAARIYGVELEGNWNFSPVDRVSTFFTYTHARFTQFNNAVDSRTNAVIPSLAGNQLPNAPDYTFRLQYAHDFGLPNGATLTPQGTFYCQTRSYTQFINDPAFRIRPYTKSDLDITYTTPDQKWSLSAYVYNVENNIVRNSDYSGPNTVFSDFGPPRTWGVRAAAKF